MRRVQPRFAILVGLFRLTVLLGLLTAWAPGLAYAGSISGVCPDGSMFIVQERSAIPCKLAKEVDPGDIPPMKPQFLPRPYGWEQFNRETDPNNPYNVIEGKVPQSAPARGPRGERPTLRGAAPPAPPSTGPSIRRPPMGVPPAPRVASAPPPLPALTFSPGDLQDLAAIVEAKQRDVPATLVRPGDTQDRGLELRLAHSQALEARIHASLGGAADAHGPVVAFHVLASDAGAFWGNLTFVQGHVAHHPDPQDPSAFRVLDGVLGALSPGETVLGYAVLPPHLDPAQPIDVYWDDRRITAILAPQG
jgi:hypothetical protein